MCKTKIINFSNKTIENEIDINEVDTDVHGNDKSRLISLVEKFKDSFVKDFLRTRVNTGQLEMQLIDTIITA